MLVFDDSCVRCFGIRIIDHRIALIVLHTFQQFCLERDGTVLQMTILIIEIAVYLTRIDDSLCKGIQRIFLVEIINTQTDFTSFNHLLDKCCISTFRDALILIVEVVVVERKAYRQTFDDKSRKFCTLASPLLLRITFDERLVDILTNQADGLFFQILWIFYMILFLLFFNLGFRLFWSLHTPHLIESVHIEGQIIEFAFVVGHRRVCVTIELHKTIHEVPDLLVAGVKDMRTILMHINALHILRIDISTDMVTLVNQKNGIALLLQQIGRDCAKETCTDNQKIIFLPHIYHYLRMLAIVTIMVAIEAADVPIAAYSAVVILFFCFFDGTTIVQPG